MIAKGIKSTLGGICKNEASKKEIAPRALGPEGLYSHSKTQL